MQFLTRGKGRLALVGVTGLSVLAVALGTFLPVAFASGQGETREFILEASRFSYSPQRLRVNLGDTVILRLRPQDVSHGLYLDGYDVETHAMPSVPGLPGGEGVLKFVADRPGMFRFRCSVTCGPLHPFMIGELNVESGTPYTNAPFLAAAAATILVGGGALAYVWRGKGTNDGSAS
jgi:cytochrome c oxidase subunit 2